MICWAIAMRILNMPPVMMGDESLTPIKFCEFDKASLRETRLNPFTVSTGIQGLSQRSKE
jgi:hypothetical protein